MWNENAPMELLKEMPRVLTEENLSKIQEVIDNDKFINSKIRQADLCGEYAPFCDICDKSVKYPCAVAYVKMMQKQGLDVEMIVTPVQPEEPVVEEPVIEEVAEEPVIERPKSGIRIRIAIARKKIN